MSVHDIYGTYLDDLLSCDNPVARSLNLEFEKRFSSYLGMHYQAYGSSGESYLIHENYITENDEGGTLPQWPDVKVVMQVAGLASIENAERIRQVFATTVPEIRLLYRSTTEDGKRVVSKAVGGSLVRLSTPEF